ncbi:MAG: hypothetical protein K0S51_2116 [Bacillales bacterium]|jgi:hypothetical protein|nr:hypothetical protein [Bacillales bacterium]MDF2947437.1 hypothetical protein [Bacillales bacterium]
MTHAHLTSIVLALVIFCAAYLLQRSGKNVKVLHMILRVMYVLVFITGGMLFFKMDLLYGLKLVLGLWFLGLFEMILIRDRKGGNTSGLWIQFVIVLIGLIYLGLKLPQGLFYF